MYLSQIELSDWMAYKYAKFEFPAPVAGANIILIGAPNGYGKTSFFKAFILGMFGSMGLRLFSLSPFSKDHEKHETPYDIFLKKSLHQEAIMEGRNSCSVKLTFVTNEEEPIEIKRTWYFSGSGEYRPLDEEVCIFKGHSREALGPSGCAASERVHWYNDYIIENLLPHNLAHFFVFDGEGVSTLADRKHSDQIRMGIEGLLGIPVLRRLITDLRDYAKQRRKNSPSKAPETVKNHRLELDRLENELNNKLKQRKEIEPKQQELKENRKNLVDELGKVGVSSQASLQKIFEEKKQHEDTIAGLETDLTNLLENEIALSLVGHKLREKLALRLEGEIVREQWESGKSQGDSNLEIFLGAVNIGINSITPSLLPSQIDAVLNTARAAWKKLWSPPPHNCANEYLHVYLNSLGRKDVIKRINEIDKLSVSKIAKILNEKSTTESKLLRLIDALHRTQSIAPSLEEKEQEYTKTDEQITILDKKIGALDREIISLESQINNLRTNIANLEKQLDQAKPSTRRATRAEEVATLVETIVNKAVPSQIEAIANQMTGAYKSIAHKKDQVKEITIDDDCNVKLLNYMGINIRDYGVSAGEKQIFTHALISAVSSVSGRAFPMLIDTPLGRLDDEHRKGLLKHLAKKNHQVILLSTDTEVVGEYLIEINGSVQKKYLLDFDQSSGMGQSTASVGYFDDSESLS